MAIIKGVRNRCTVVQKFTLEKQTDFEIFFFYLKYEGFMMKVLLDSDFRNWIFRICHTLLIYFIVVEIMSQILFFSMVKDVSRIIRSSKYINSLLSTYY